MDCVTKQTRITHEEYFAYKYGAMISSVSDYACAVNPNDKILNLKQVKDEPLEIRRRFSAFGFVLYLNDTTAQSRVRVRVRVGSVRVRALYKGTLTDRSIICK